MAVYYKLTPYDSPAIWNGRPLNFGKCSKKIATKEAMSTAASAVVLWGIDEALGFAKAASDSIETTYHLLPVIRI